MMHALVVFESMYGNTQTIAAAIADGLTSHMKVDLVEVGAAPTVIPDDVELLIVGGPTHAFGMSRSSTREDAAKRSGHSVVSDRIGLREWLDALERRSGRVTAAAFDTTLAKPRFLRLMSSASRKANKRLRRLGFRFVVSPERFWVTGSLGPLQDGEEERARRWGEQLGAKLAQADPERQIA